MPYRPEPVPVQLSDVYAMDFGRRTADLPLWATLRALYPSGSVCEIGVGDGRASLALPGPRYGVDLDRAFVYRARERGIEAFLGDAAEPATWLPVPADCGLVFCAYSTLFLVKHDRQADVLRNAAAKLRPGGCLSVEVFLPVRDAVIPSHDAPVGNPNGVGEPWTRRTTYSVRDHGDGTGTTRAHRLYGQGRDDWRMELDETIYWRTPESLVSLFAEAGLPDAFASVRNNVVPGGLRPNIPDGSALVSWVRPLEAR